MYQKNVVLLLAFVMICCMFILVGNSPAVYADCSFYEIESNNTQSTANGPLNPNTTIYGTTDYMQGIPDWFKISCVQNSALRFYLTGNVGYISGYIYDNNGFYLGTIGYNQNYILTPSYTGYIYVQITGYAYVPYNLRVANVFVEAEPNNSQGAANGPVNPNTTIYGSTDPVQGVPDWFKINCVQYNSLTFYLTGSSNYISGYIYDRNGNYLGYINYNQSYSLTPGYTGYIYVQISGYNYIPYTLSVTQ